MGGPLSGLNDSIRITPPRPPGAVRRTSHIDIAPGSSGDLSLRGAARDLHTSAAGAGGGATVVAGATVRAELDAGRRLASLETSPAAAATQPLLGLPVGRGFRAALDHQLPDERRGSTPLYLLLDELPVATLISGYAQLHRGELGDRQGAAQHLNADICAGWRSDGTMMVTLRASGEMPVPLGPPANDLVPRDDPLAWHELGALPAGAMRRQRLVQVAPGYPLAVYAMFRDTHADATGNATILHEYSLTAALDPHSLRLTRCEARPQVLPWTECPAAAASAPRLDGRHAGEVRQLIRNELRGTSTCTHLNDLLRSLADLAALAPAVADPTSRR